MAEFVDGFEKLAKIGRVYINFGSAKLQKPTSFQMAFDAVIAYVT